MNVADQFIEQVFKRLPPTIDVDKIEFTAFIRSLYLDGYTEDDAVAYMKCMEEFDPELDEDTALARMNKLRTKYNG